MGLFYMKYYTVFCLSFYQQGKADFSNDAR
jgi:hypothetical protein